MNSCSEASTMPVYATRVMVAALVTCVNRLRWLAARVVELPIEVALMGRSLQSSMVDVVPPIRTSRFIPVMLEFHCRAMVLSTDRVTAAVSTDWMPFLLPFSQLRRMPPFPSARTRLLDMLTEDPA